MSDEVENETVYRPLPLCGEPYRLPKGAPEPAANTIAWWGLRKAWPAWLVAAMQAGRPVNEELSEDAVHALAEQVCGLPLGRRS